MTDILETVIIQRRNTGRMVTVTGALADSIMYSYGQIDHDRVRRAVNEVGATGALVGEHEINFIWT